MTDLVSEDKMENHFQTEDGLILHLLRKLSNDFDKIFCEVKDNMLSFIGARNHLSLKFNFSFNKGLKWINKKEYNINKKYIFDKNTIKNNLRWFKTRTNLNNTKRLELRFKENQIEIKSQKVDTKLTTEIKNPPIPIIPKRENDGNFFVLNPTSVYNQIKSIQKEIIKIQYDEDNGLTMSNDKGNPLYKIDYTTDGEFNKKIKTYCYKAPLLVSFRLTKTIDKSVDFIFQDNGATQLNMKSVGHPNIDGRIILTSVSRIV